MCEAGRGKRTSVVHRLRTGPCQYKLTVTRGRPTADSSLNSAQRKEVESMVSRPPPTTYPLTPPPFAAVKTSFTLAARTLKTHNNMWSLVLMVVNALAQGLE